MATNGDCVTSKAKPNFHAGRKDAVRVVVLCLKTLLANVQPFHVHSDLHQRHDKTRAPSASRRHQVHHSCRRQLWMAKEAWTQVMVCSMSRNHWRSRALGCLWGVVQPL